MVNNYLVIAVCLGLAEALRRCILIMITALMGPLSKVPGPFLSKFTRIPWAVETVTGKHMNTTDDLFKKYGDVVRVAPNHVIVGDRAGIHKVLVEKDLVKAPFFDNMRLHPGNPMLVTERDKESHKRTRRLLSPGFSISYLDGLEPFMQECIQEFEKVLDSKCDENDGTAVVDMQGVLSNLTFDVMSATSLGGSFNLVTSNNTKLKKTFMSILIKAAINGQFPYLRYIPFWPQAIPPDMNRMLDDVLDRRESVGKPAKKDIVQIILDAHQMDPIGFPEMRMRDEVTMFMVAGSETTSSNSTAILMLLVNNMDKLQRLIEEIDSVFSRNDEVTFTKLQELPYLNAVLWEGLRLVAPSAGLLRYTTEPIMINDYEIPPDTTVQPWPMAAMKDPRIWPDAEKFIPERWLGVYKGVEANRADVIAFSAGSRNCIGWQFAMREMRLIFARLLLRYELSLVPGQSHERRYHSTPWFVQGFYKVEVKLRK
ncbi:cytochrome P450 [Hyaloscypha variabilis F]|uniref:Cytochrome P450 n=1 Tax=Hyaloscypha variabilis (strain UAMH 11265 / GT02V1 / F) TaxID=1149755 RepID=A0A2J6RE56_HYAVF|nr:cytochrome P450 [Hyaloscypha variabilis F]